MERVSVIIVSYRNGDTLFRAIDSVLMQTYENIELLVCDDGTPSFDEKIVSDYIKKSHISYKIIHQKQNVGTVRNLNTGVKASEGKWVLVLAADDVLFDTSVVNCLVNEAIISDKEWYISYTQTQNGKLPNEQDIKRLRMGNKVDIYSRLCEHCFIPSCGTLYKKSFLQEQGYFDESYRLVEDWPMFLKWIRNGIIPQIVELTSVKKFDGGVSNNHAGKNKTYQQDLIHVIQNEILPFSHDIDEIYRKQLVRNCKDKILIYDFRFSCTTIFQKFYWIIRNADIIYRKVIKNRGENIND